MTKSGTQQFHGSGWYNYRNNWMNANDWFNKNNFNPSSPNAACTGCYGITPRAKYRYNVRGYSIGGPVYIPGHFNTEKKRLFFFSRRNTQANLHRPQRHLGAQSQVQRHSRYPR